MTSVKVAVRVRPRNQREDASTTIIEMDGNKTKITNPKVPETGEMGDHGRDHLKLREFTFDHSFWSVSPDDPHFVAQEQVFKALGLDVVSAAFEGYNVCVFAYGQTGSGKTYTMMGSEGNPGLIPRFCEELFARMDDPSATYRTQVSYLEIYNEKVRDLLKYSSSNVKPSHKLRIREHPKEGPYVQDLSHHTVVSYDGIAQLMSKGNANRTTAATLMNDVSSRSHAIFTITFTQAKFEDGLPSERQSKIHLVDLAGSERADASGATGQRLKEGGSINRSLVTLGNVISILAEASEEKVHRSRGTFIPYRDSVLTWLLKDSLGGNAKTIMIATISPADINYGETLSTLRYANRAKNIINRPTVNEDANVRLIRELREEIARLKALLTGTDNISSPRVQEKLHENEARIKVLTAEWADKWRESASILQEEKNLELRKEGVGVILDSTLPHLIGVSDDILSTGIMLYHLKEGITTIGTEDSDEPQDITIAGPEVEQQHCVIEYRNGVVTLHPIEEALCTVNGHLVTDPVKLQQGEVVVLGRTNMFRFNHPAEAQKLKQMRKAHSTLSLSNNSHVLGNSRTSLLSHSMADLYQSNDSLYSPAASKQGVIWEFEETHREEQEMLDTRRQEIEDLEERHRQKERGWQTQQSQLEEELKTKEQQVADLQDKMTVIRETMSPAKSIEEALQRLEEQEQTQLMETRQMKEQLLKELHDLDSHHAAADSSMELALSQVDQQLASRQVQISALQEESGHRRKALQEEKQKEEERTEALKSELTAVRGEIKERRETLLAQDPQLQATYSQLTQAESQLREQYTKLDQTKNAEWKGILDSLSEENYRIEEAWQDLTEQESAVDQKLSQGRFASDQERMECENHKEQLLQARILLKEEEEKIATTQQKEMERVEGEMEKWTQQKENELSAAEKKRDDLLRQHSKEIDSLFVQSELKLSEIQTQQEKSFGVDRLLKSLEEDVQKQIGDLQEEQKKLMGVKEKKQKERKMAEEEKTQREKELEDRLKDIQEWSDREMQKIKDEKQRLVSLQKQVEENQGNQDGLDCTGSAATQVLQEREKELEEKKKECEALEEQICSLQEELSSQQRQQEEERDRDMDTIEFKKLQLQELERQERINALVEQEVKRRLFDEKVEREKQRRMEREKERQEREKEIQKLKSVHERELRHLRAKLENSKEGSKSNPYGHYGSLDSTSNNRKKLVRQLSVGRPCHVEIAIPNYALHGAGRDTHYEYEVKVKIGDEMWSVFRRYSKFRELHQTMRKKYPNVDILVFPPRKLFHKSERVAAERRVLLEQYLANLIELCQRCRECPLHPDNNPFLTKHILADFDPFFRRGLFEHTRLITS
ncbi:kinesin-like protein KIF16B isoform X2 [Babylonia areolata]|uniref:kinesin-like protein KIF16B isoform X2 n=1 Tax=Babylonia areolata TaxID=304850 RepID=UPI003FCF2D30